ncbi:hypothetical protein [Leptolyngbya sp. GGD]|uniref:hypothetical protein n=1 Tax=Leptolyngbya sp. GGD TaxID=2997907 RepID=UPI00227AF6C2|nr:hypothetical protein [Leptolyngbya sp. GGD]MCY6491441.1 hypothetical protein [Leptolyngbya sp. GGD]
MRLTLPWESRMILQHLAQDVNQAFAVGFWQMNPQLLIRTDRRGGGIRSDISHVPAQL